MSVHQNLEILASRPIGYVAKCHECQSIQVVIGTIISEMTIAGFKNLCTSFDKLIEESKNRLMSFPDGLKLVLGTGSDHIHMCLNQEQFEQTLVMLHEALIELSLEQELNELLA